MELAAGVLMGLNLAYVIWHIITSGGNRPWPRLIVRLSYRHRTAPTPVHRDNVVPLNRRRPTHPCDLDELHRRTLARR